MIWIKGESAFERHWSPGKLFVDCTTTTVPWLSAQPLPGGMPLGNESFIFMAVALKGSKKGGKRHKKKKKTFRSNVPLVSFISKTLSHLLMHLLDVHPKRKKNLSIFWALWGLVIIGFPGTKLLECIFMHSHAFVPIDHFRCQRLRSFSNELKPLKSQTNTYWY